MAQVEKLKGESCRYADFSIDGVVVSVGTATIDCGAMQDDSERIIDICAVDMGELVVGAENGKTYVLSCIIPPKQYEIVDEQPAPLPLDPDTIVIKLWPYQPA